MSTYIHRDNQQYGPFKDGQIRSMLEDGSLTPEDLAWQAGMPAWVPVAQLFITTAKSLPPIPLSAASHPTHARVALWDPNTAANFSLLFSPAFGVVLHYLNWKALGQTKEAGISLNWLIGSIVVPVVFLLGLIVAPKITTNFGRFLGIGLFAWYFAHAKKQVAFVKQEVGTNYRKKSFLVPILVSIGVLIALFSALNNLSNRLN